MESLRRGAEPADSSSAADRQPRAHKRLWTSAIQGDAAASTFTPSRRDPSITRAAAHSLPVESE